MKTCLVTTTYLVPQERFDKTIKFIDYYKDQVNEPWDIYVLDNASPIDILEEFCKKIGAPHRVQVISFDVHYDRPSHLEYGYLWRSVYYMQHLLKTYDRIVYMDNDFFILNKDLIDRINNTKSGWTTVFCNRHNFNETGFYVLCKNNTSYNDFVKDLTEEEFIKKYNGKCMETTLPIENIVNNYIGDRYSEMDIMEQRNFMDYYAQALTETQFRYKK